MPREPVVVAWIGDWRAETWLKLHPHLPHAHRANRLAQEVLVGFSALVRAHHPAPVRALKIADRNLESPSAQR